MLELRVELLPLTVPEIRHLLWGLATSTDPQAIPLLAWSHWRRRHQAAARRSHYKRRLSLIAR
jgi:hypothetical protein